jgi:hypothetical protein
MTRIFAAAIVSLYSAGAFAAGPSCKEQADDLKLAGTTLTGFLTRCERDAMASCDTSALVSRLSGAARTSFAKKCVEVMVGMDRCADLLRDSFRPQLVVRSIAGEDETASCHALCGSGSPLSVGCDRPETVGGGDGAQRRVDLE